MRIEIELRCRDWKKDGGRREDQFHRNAAAVVLRGIADRLQNGGAVDARFDRGDGVIGVLKTVDE